MPGNSVQISPEMSASQTASMLIVRQDLAYQSPKENATRYAQ